MTDYDAILSVKSHTDGQSLRERVTAEEIWYDHEGPLTLVLVHGYRNDERAAVANYRLFIRSLSRLDDQLAAAAMTFSWPSMPSWRDGLQIFRKYDGVARQTGRLLAGFIERDIRRHAVPRDYLFIAHSLGSRVVIEMIRALDEKGVDYGRRVRIVLMAAAVDNLDLPETGGTPEYAALAKLRGRYALYSKDDKILSSLFRKGMLWSVDEAIGLNGHPTKFWTDGAVEMPEYGHSHYWPDIKHKVSKFMADMLGIPFPDPLPSDLVDPGNPMAGPSLPSA